jgi:hypothetical protein
MTFLRYFCLATNVRSFAKALSLPDTPEYNAMMHSFRKLFEAKTCGVLLDNLAPNVTDAPRVKLSQLEVLEDNVYQGLLHCINLDIDDTSSCFGTWDDLCSIHPLLNCKARFIHRIKVRGVTYSTFKSHAGNSFVLFRCPTTPSQLMCAFLMPNYTQSNTSSQCWASATSPHARKSRSRWNFHA